jgi:prophage regulatory protein
VALAQRLQRKKNTSHYRHLLTFKPKGVQKMAVSNELTLLRLKQIIGSKKEGIEPIFPVSKASWYAGIAEGKYPKSVKIGARSVAWKSSEIQALIAELG